jgi:tripartite-type tricarboxylate transporter receptor subunit TctC
MTRSSALKTLLAVIGALAFAGTAIAQQNYPNRPLRMVIPWPPGQATDLVGRVVAQKLTDLLQQARQH